LRNGAQYIRKKLALIEWLTKLDDEKVLEKLLDISNLKGDHYELSKEERESIITGLEDLKNGNVVPHAGVRKLYEKWL